MHILILGNGFDIVHGLKTRYTDFLDYCKKNDLVDGNLWLKHFFNRKQDLGNKWIDLEEEIYNVIKNIDEHIYRISGNYKRQIFPKTYFFSTSYTDTDFDLGKIVNELKTSSNKYKIDEKEYKSVDTHTTNSLCYFFVTYKGFINFLYDHLRVVVEYFDKYLTDEILPNIANKKFNFSLTNQNPITVLNFNYTNTYEKLYGIHSIYAHQNPKYVYIHGRVGNSNDCNLILGTHSFLNNLPNDLNESINVEFNVFKKHNQRHRYGTIEAYQDLLKELNDKRKVITPTFHIIGHSLDRADHNILRHIFRARENSTIKIYYHNQDALNRLINNITEIIGEDEVMAKVRFINQHDPKHGIILPQQEAVLT